MHAQVHANSAARSAMTATTATWTKIASSEILRRSSQVIWATSDSVFVFGGELLPRQPRDNHVHLVKLNGKLTSYLLLHEAHSLTGISSFRTQCLLLDPVRRVQLPFTQSGHRIYLAQWQGLHLLRPRRRGHESD